MPRLTASHDVLTSGTVVAVKNPVMEGYDDRIVLAHVEAHEYMILDSDSNIELVNLCAERLLTEVVEEGRPLPASLRPHLWIAQALARDSAFLAEHRDANNWPVLAHGERRVV